MDRFDILNKLVDFESKLKDIGFKTYISTEYFEKDPECNFDFIHSSISIEKRNEDTKTWTVYDCTFFVRYDKFLNTFVIYRNLYDNWNQQMRHFQKCISNLELNNVPFEYLIKTIANEIYNWEMRLDNSSEYRRKINIFVYGNEDE